MEDMFKELRSVLDKCQSRYCKSYEWNDEDYEFFKNIEWYLAKAIYNEVPESDKVAKLILVMSEK